MTSDTSLYPVPPTHPHTHTLFNFTPILLCRFDSNTGINVANEQLQRYFNEHIFTTELAELKAEGIAAPTIDYADNSLTLDLFLKRTTGLFAILDEESYFPRGTDASLTTKLHSGLKKNKKVYTAPKSGRDLMFTIAHYAGQ